MVTVARNLKLERRSSVGGSTAIREPDGDVLCPECLREGRELMTIFYRATINGQLWHVHHCPRSSHEVTELTRRIS